MTQSVQMMTQSMQMKQSMQILFDNDPESYYNEFNVAVKVLPVRMILYKSLAIIFFVITFVPYLCAFVPLCGI